MVGSGLAGLRHPPEQALAHQGFHLVVGVERDQVVQLVRVGLQVVEELLDVVVALGSLPPLLSGALTLYFHLCVRTARPTCDSLICRKTSSGQSSAVRLTGAARAPVHRAGHVDARGVQQRRRQVDQADQLVTAARRPRSPAR